MTQETIKRIPLHKDKSIADDLRAVRKSYANSIKRLGTASGSTVVPLYTKEGYFAGTITFSES